MPIFLPPSGERSSLRNKRYENCGITLFRTLTRIGTLRWTFIALPAWVLMLAWLALDRSTTVERIRGSNGYTLAGCICKKPADTPILPHVHSLCSDSATARGAEQRVVAVSINSLHGKDALADKDTLVAQAESIKHWYPGFAFRIYLDTPTMLTESAQSVICPLFCEKPHVDVCLVDNLPDKGAFWDIKHQPNGNFWRFLPLRDDLVSVMMSRDAHNPITKRESSAVHEWLNSGDRFLLHIMRDNKDHGGWPIVSGWWGMKLHDKQHRTSVTNPLIDQLLFGEHGDRGGIEQTALALTIYPKLADRALAHDSYLCRHPPSTLETTRPWPTQAVVIHGSDGKLLRYSCGLRDPRPEAECPLACRPKDHQDWLYC